MSVANRDVEGTATCPLCADYEGQPSSVESHISAKTDPVHQGEVGRAHRDDIRRQAESDEGGDVEGSVSFPVPVEDDEEDVAGTEEEVAATREEDGEEVDVDAPSGIPLPVSQGTFFVAVIVVAGVLFWLSRRSSSPAGSSTSEEADEQESGETTMLSRDAGGGLSA